jgi:two-component system response regulator GlrR
LAAYPELLVQVVDRVAVSAALSQLEHRRSVDPGRPTLIVAVDLDRQQLCALLGGGAVDFVFVDAIDQELVVRARRLLGQIADPSIDPASLPALPGIIGRSSAFVEQVLRLPTVARYDVSVLILGETGTGKEVFAQAAHYLSPRTARPWVAVNCGAIPTDLIEDELFGHVRGAYTHAHSARPGLIREAEGGTLFLDEIDSLPAGAQVKLLRFLQDKEYRAVGSSQTLRADVRVLAASNRQLAQLAAEGRFRQDLFFRLNVITLHLPPLRERRADIVPLALHFLAAAGRQWQKPAPTLAPDALNKLLAHRWPGNVRELKNVIDRATLLSNGGVLAAQHIELDGEAAADPLAPCEGSLRSAKARVVESFERAYIEQLLATSGGNVTHAARAAQKNRRAFFELLRKYRIAPERFR